MLLEPNKHPLVTLLTQVGKVWDGQAWKGVPLRKSPAFNPEFKWIEDYYGGRYCKVSGTYVTGAVTVTVTGAGSSSAYIFTPGDIVLNKRTGERMRVATIASATTITFGANDRSFGSTAEAAGADGDGLFLIGNVSEENSNARNVNTTRTTNESNFTQIFKTSIAVSGTEKEVKLYGGPDLRYQRIKKGTEHALDIERSFWFSEKNSDSNGTQGHPRRSTGGVLEFIEGGNSYVQNQGGVLTAPDLNTFLREGFTYSNGGSKYLFCGNVVLQAINELARDQIRIVPTTSSYGLNLRQWFTAFGTVNLIHNPLFVEDYSGYAFLLDLEGFGYRFLSNRDTKLFTNVQANDTDGQVDQYLTECGLERKQAPLHAMLKGVTA